jgi:hypothetical protein
MVARRGTDRKDRQVPPDIWRSALVRLLRRFASGGWELRVGESFPWRPLAAGQRAGGPPPGRCHRVPQGARGCRKVPEGALKGATFGGTFKPKGRKWIGRRGSVPTILRPRCGGVRRAQPGPQGSTPGSAGVHGGVHFVWTPAKPLVIKGLGDQTGGGIHEGVKGFTGCHRVSKPPTVSWTLWTPVPPIWSIAPDARCAGRLRASGRLSKKGGHAVGRGPRPAAGLPPRWWHLPDTTCRRESIWKTSPDGGASALLLQMRAASD